MWPDQPSHPSRTRGMWTLSPSNVADLSAEACLLQLQRCRSCKQSKFNSSCFLSLGQLWSSLPVVRVECDIIPVNSDAGLEDFLDVFVPRPFQFWVTWFENLNIYITTGSSISDHLDFDDFLLPYFCSSKMSRHLNRSPFGCLKEFVKLAGNDTDLNKKLFDHNLAPLPR